MRPQHRQVLGGRWRQLGHRLRGEQQPAGLAAIVLVVESELAEHVGPLADLLQRGEVSGLLRAGGIGAGFRVAATGPVVIMNGLTSSG